MEMSLVGNNYNNFYLSVMLLANYTAWLQRQIAQSCQNDWTWTSQLLTTLELLTTSPTS